MQPGDPFTPLLRAYANDKIQVRTLVGAHLNPHFFNIHGVKWLFEPSAPNSGWRSTQAMSLSEHFEMNFTLPNAKGNKLGDNTASDYLYVTSADLLGFQHGLSCGPIVPIVLWMIWCNYLTMIQRKRGKRLSLAAALRMHLLGNIVLR